MKTNRIYLFFVATTLPASSIFPIVSCNKVKSLDYSNSSNWMLKEEYGTSTADVFYLYPTVSSGQDTEIPQINDDFKKKAYAQTSINIKCLDPVANIYAPYYHQLSQNRVLKFKTATEMYNAIKNNQTIKQDVFNALDYYFKYHNNNKPYILASHSQGSLVMQVVLEEYMKLHPDYYSRMVCAYTLGMNYTQEYGSRNTHVKFAAGEADTGVVMTWNSFGVGATPGFTTRNDEKPIGYINPITWAKDDKISLLEQHKGGYDRTTGCCTESFVTCHLDLEKHLLVLDNNNEWNQKYKEAFPTIEELDGFFGKKTYHFEDWRLFAGNIRENAQKRINAFINKGNLHT